MAVNEAPPTRSASEPLRERPRIRQLRERIRREAEDRPGIYRMMGHHGETLYVGRSKRIRRRLLSHLRSREGKSAELLRSTRSIGWEHLPDEFGTVLREVHLIRAYRPRFNVQHKHQRRPFFLKLTREPAPRLLLVREPRRDAAQYFGPFPMRSSIARSVRDLAHSAGLRDCPARTPIHFADQLELVAALRSPLCIRGETGTCPAPCAALCTASEYDTRVETVRAFLTADGRQPLEEVRRKMDAAAGCRKFELAAFLRNRLERLKRLQEELVAFRGEVDALSVLYRPEGSGGDRRLYFLRKGRLMASIPAPSDEREVQAARTQIARCLSEPAPTPADLGTDGAVEVLLVASWFRNRPEERARTIDPEAWLRASKGHSADPG